MSIHSEATETKEEWKKGHSLKSTPLPKRVGWGAG